MKKKIKIKRVSKNINGLILYSIFIFILFISIGYSSMSTTLRINGKGYFRVADWIRITSFNLSNTSSGGVENYNSKYSKNELISSINLPSGSSSVTYSFTIENSSEKYGYIKNITKSQFSNNSVEYEINNCNINDIIEPHQVLNCTITFKNTSGSNLLSSIIEYEFDELIGSNTELIGLSVLNYTLSPPFVSNVEDYSVDVEDKKITIIATASDPRSTITGDGEVSVAWGKSTKEVIVTAEDSSEKKYKIEVNNIRPTAPVIEIDNNSYVKDKHVVSITTEGEALSDVDHYEYYISDTNTTPSDDVTVDGTTNGSTDIAIDGIKYVFYRTVSKHGNNSVWSNAVESKIDKQEPYVNITATDTYPNDVPTITFNPTAVDNESGIDYYEIYYKLSTDTDYTKVIGNSVTGTADKKYNYYLVAYDNVGNHSSTEVKEITLKTLGEDESCGYNYSDYTSTTTNDLSECTASNPTDDGLEYTTCSLGNWSSATTSRVDSCASVPQTSTGTSYITCTLDPTWTESGNSNVNSCTASETTTSKVTCTTNSWSSSSSQTNSCTASGSSSSNTQYITCTENGWGTGKVDYTTSCSAKTENTTKVTCEGGYYKHSCTNGILTWDKKPTYPSGAASSCTNTSGYYKKITYTRSYKYTKKTYTRVSKYKKTDYYKKYTKNTYSRLYNKTVYTRTRSEKTCWH